ATCIAPDIRPPRHERTPADRSRPSGCGAASLAGADWADRRSVIAGTNTGTFRGPKEAVVYLRTSGGELAHHDPCPALSARARFKLGRRTPDYHPRDKMNRWTQRADASDVQPTIDYAPPPRAEPPRPAPTTLPSASGEGGASPRVEVVAGSGVHLSEET